MPKNKKNQHVLDWIAALRSGNFYQGAGCLRDRSGPTVKFCPLGVAIQIADESLLVRNPYVHVECDYVHDGLDYRNSRLPDWLAWHLGLSDLDQNEVMVLNDRLGLSFKQIAAHLEAWQDTAPQTHFYLWFPRRTRRERS